MCDDCSSSEIVAYGERCFDCGVISNDSRTCDSCRISSPRHVWVTTNYENAAKKLVQAYKFGHQRAAADSLALLMITNLLDFKSIADLHSLNYLVVPVSTATSRVRQRGFDHSSLLARKIANNLKIEYIEALTRLGQTRQLGTDRSARLKQLNGKFVVRYPDLLHGRNILLVDDVITTGGTLRAATKALRVAGASRIDALAFAKKL
ncbi:MAG TPA: phosphoribosyltransferase family protein [Candidatus Saccharimonadales bacterium]|nr:phosphoribosyltransferase family protein [Candidatus Saccharimonadales bacterium]